MLDAYGRGDVDGALANAHPEIVWNPFEEAPMRGVDAVRAYLARWESEWEEPDSTPDEFIDAGDRVVAIVRFRGRGKGSGIEVDGLSHAVYAVRDGKAVAMEEFTGRSKALEAAGLSE